MTTPDSRRNFLRGRFSPRQGPLRPPWALAESDFLTACTRCGDCVTACPTQVIITRDAGYPTVNFTDGECTFCGGCAAACKTGALLLTEGQAPWSACALIADHCLARQRVECRICGDQCEAGAIRFQLQAGGIATPQLDQERCTGCGACVGPCPVRAIVVK